MAVETVSDPELDGQAVEARRRADLEDPGLLYETYRDRVYSLARHFTGDESLAWDLTQEIFLKLFARIGEFRGDAKFETWLYRIVANACIDEQRKRKRFVRLEPNLNQQHLNRTEPQPQEVNYMRREAAQAVQAAVVRLKPALRLPILLRYVEGLSYDEIGQALGCNAGTVAARLYRGHRILARELTAFRGVTL